MSDLIIDSMNSAISDVEYAITKGKRKRSLSTIETGSQISLYPLYGENNSYEGDETLTFPVSPSDIMFNEDSDSETIKLINYGELNVGMNRKLTTWSFDSFFPYRTNNVPKYSRTGQTGYVDGGSFKYWFDVSDGVKDPYEYYCNKILTWKKDQTPLVFFFKTWGTYYNCLIKKFSYGRKDAVGNVYYQIEFQEYKEYTFFDMGSASTDYSSDTYYPAEGETLLQICKKLYGDSDKYQYFMNLNGMTNIEIKAGQAYKVR
jgi:hypothetical protein